MHIYSWKGLHTSLWLSTTDTNTRLLFIKKNILSVYYCQYCNAGNVKHIIMAVFNMWNTKIACQGLNLKQGGEHKKVPILEFATWTGMATVCLFCLNLDFEWETSSSLPAPPLCGCQCRGRAASSCSWKSRIRCERSKVGNWDKIPLTELLGLC